MLSYLFDPFRSGRTDKSRQSKRRRQLRQTRSDQASGRGLSLAFQLLEPRLALTVWSAGSEGEFWPGPAGSINKLSGGGFAYNIVVDDTVNASGNGRDVYVQHGFDGIDYMLVSDNPGFSSPHK